MNEIYLVEYSRIRSSLHQKVQEAFRRLWLKHTGSVDVPFEDFSKFTDLKIHINEMLDAEFPIEKLELDENELSNSIFQKLNPLFIQDLKHEASRFRSESTLRATAQVLGAVGLSVFILKNL